jgi:hypothetical protein
MTRGPQRSPTQAEALMAQAHALERVAASLEAFRPAADTVHGFAERLDRLCNWLCGRWPWVIGLAATALVRTINLSPDDLPKIAAAIAGVARAIAPTH